MYEGTGFTHKFAKDVISDNMKNHPSLAVVRNPYDRLYSIYSFYSSMRNDISASLTFKDFVLSYEKAFMGMLQGNGHPHACNQCFDYVSYDNKLIVTDIIHFENLEHGYGEFCKKYSILASLIHKNKNPKKNTFNKSSLYTKEMKEIVDTMFQRRYDTIRLFI